MSHKCPGSMEGKHCPCYPDYADCCYCRASAETVRDAERKARAAVQEWLDGGEVQP